MNSFAELAPLRPVEEDEKDEDNEDESIGMSMRGLIKWEKKVEEYKLKNVR